MRMTLASNGPNEGRNQPIRLDYARPARPITASRVFAGVFCVLLTLLGIAERAIGIFGLTHPLPDGPTRGDPDMFIVAIVFGFSCIVLGILCGCYAIDRNSGMKR